MDRIYIETSWSIDLISNYIGVQVADIKDMFERKKSHLDINNPEHIANFIDNIINNYWWVYSITNKKTWKQYIWQSCNIARRRKTHRRLLARWKHENELLQNDYNKYWYGNFIYEVIKKEENSTDRFNLEQHILKTSPIDLLYNLPSLWSEFTLEEMQDIYRYKKEIRELITKFKYQK